MKIIIEGTAEEIRRAIGSFGIPQEVIFDDGEKLIPVVRRRNCAVTRLAPEMKQAVDNMLLNGCSYSHISECLKTSGIWRDTHGKKSCSQKENRRKQDRRACA